MTHCSVLYELPSWVKNICVGFGNTDPAVFAELTQPLLNHMSLYYERKSRRPEEHANSTQKLYITSTVLKKYLS